MKILEKVMGMRKIKKIMFFKHIQMIKISAETYAKNCIHNIIEKEEIAMAEKQKFRRKNRC